MKDAQSHVRAASGETDREYLEVYMVASLSEDSELHHDEDCFK